MGHWHHELADPRAHLQSRIRSLDTYAFKSAGVDQGRDSGLFGAELEWNLPLPLQARVALGYVHPFGQKYRSNGLSVSFSLQF